MTMADHALTLTGPQIPGGSPPDAGTTETRGAQLRRFVRTQPLGAISLALIGLFVLVALLAPIIAPYDPVAQHRDHLTQGPSGQFLLGTDSLGRDVLSRAIYGTRTSLLIGVVTIVCGAVLGTLCGVVSGLLGRVVDFVIQRVMDAVLSVPPLVLLLFIAVFLGPSVRNVIIALVIVTVPGFNRVARAETLRVKQEVYVEAAYATGTGLRRIMRRHILPNMFAPMLTMASLLFAGVIIAESALSFLGIGTPPPTPSWGLMLADGLDYVEQAPWLVVAPGLILSIAVFAFNLLGDALRDFLDPKLD
jgi:peptide/nickel transport system permease protein